MTTPKRLEYPDVENATLDWLEATFEQLAPNDDVRHCDTETPPNLQDVLPFARVALVAGRDNDVTDYSVLDIDVLSNSRDTAYALARDIRSRFTGRLLRIGNVVFDSVVTEEKPRRLPWADENIWRFGATYRISARRCETT